MQFESTADLCDRLGAAVAVIAPGVFRSFGGRSRFGGRVRTIAVHGMSAPVASALADRGAFEILVVDGGGTVDVALLGDRIARIACANGWSGLLVNGAIRDAAACAGLDVGIVAIATCPRRARTGSISSPDVAVPVGGTTIRTGDWLVADEDGVIVSLDSLAT